MYCLIKCGLSRIPHRSQSEVVYDLCSNRLFIKLLQNEYDVLFEVSCKKKSARKTGLLLSFCADFSPTNLRGPILSESC